MDFVIISCPTCKDKIYIDKRDFNCKIFRHGVYKSNYQQIPPHLSKIECDKLKENDLIYGCGKPFKLNIDKDCVNAIICDYI